MNNITGTKVTGQMALMQQQMVQVLQKYFNLIQFFLIPVYALFAWLFLRRGAYNYAENMILSSVISAQMNTISVFSILLFYFIHSPTILAWYGLIAFLILIICFTISFRQFYKISFVKALLYSLLVYICAYVVQLVLLSIVLFAYVMLTR
ncbi:MAG: hypothetical protein IPP72_16445 [Chitinophagaceae bacterium]|nr:hypothetical protein [Chitinophagaceae bacterium]